MRKSSILCIILTLLLVATITVPALAATEDTLTPVTFRLSLYNYLSGASCEVSLSRFANATDETPIDSGIAPSYFSMQRAYNWELTLPLPDGFYEVTYVSMTGNWENYICGHSPRFEVKGDEVTVYIAVDNPKYPAPMPENWLVYGEDTQNFYIWDESTTEMTTPDSTPESKPVETQPLPEISSGDNNEITTLSPPDTSSPNETSTDSSETTKEPDPPLSVTIGNYIYIGFAFALLFASLYLYIRTQKKRGA